MDDVFDYVQDLCDRLDSEEESLIDVNSSAQALSEWTRRVKRRTCLERADKTAQKIQQVLQQRIDENIHILDSYIHQFDISHLESHIVKPRCRNKDSSEHWYSNQSQSGHELQIFHGDSRPLNRNSPISKPPSSSYPHTPDDTSRSELDTQKCVSSMVCAQTTTNSQSTANMFDGLTFFFVRLGSLAKFRIDLLSQKVLQKGGTVVDTFSEQVTHVIVGDNISFAKTKSACIASSRYQCSQLSTEIASGDTETASSLEQHLNTEVHIHTAEWISNSLRSGMLCDEYIHRLLPDRFEIISQSASTDTSQQNELVQKPRVKWESRFACQQKTPDKKPAHPNQDITDELQRLLTIYQQTGEAWRTVAYRKAIAAIQRYPKRIESGEEALKINGVGKGISEKINDYLSSGKISKLESLKENKKIQTIQLFCRIWGVGVQTAELWYSQGFRTIDDLKQKAKLNSQQQIGIKYLNDLQHRIPRAEVEAIVNVVKHAALKMRPSLEIIPCGSYRRGKSDSGDVDILITDRSNDDIEFEWNAFLPSLCKYLSTHDSDNNAVLDLNASMLSDSEEPFLVAHLSTARRSDSGEMGNYMGICRLKGYKHARRIDIKLYQPEHFPFAVLYFTGSDHFNRSMRLLANKKGLSLSDKSLRHVVRCNRKKVHEGKEIPCNTEREIFAALNLDYREPYERDI